MNVKQLKTMLELATTVQLSAMQCASLLQDIEKLERNLRVLDNQHNKQISRRVDVEQTLFNMALGKLPLPSWQDCRIMAIRLGTPKEEWPEIVKNHTWEGRDEIQNH